VVPVRYHGRTGPEPPSLTLHKQEKTRYHIRNEKNLKIKVAISHMAKELMRQEIYRYVPVFGKI